MVHMISRPQSTSSFISIFYDNSDFYNYSTAAPNNPDVYSLLYHILLDVSVYHILLGDFNLHHPLYGKAQAFAGPMTENFISIFIFHFSHSLLPQKSITGSENGHETTINSVLASPPLENSL